ncbi:MAG: hypothetical protein ACYS30_19985 [Planctomycetota bacterium]|jgi:hypothetical protein
MSKSLTVRTDSLDIMTVADMLVKSGFFQDAKQQAQAVVKVLAGAELGFGPIASMSGINIVRGRPQLSANLMASAIKSSGKYNYRVVEHTDEKCVIEFFEDGQSVGISSFSMTDAQRAGLKGDNWTKYPRNMLFARALSNGARWYTPDVFGGPTYTEGEMPEAPTDSYIDAHTGEIVEGEPFSDVREMARRDAAEKKANGVTVDASTVAWALTIETAKGTEFGELDAEQLQMVLDRTKDQDRIDAARILLHPDAAQYLQVEEDEAPYHPPELDKHSL